MTKEGLFAVIFGFLIGFMVAAGIFFLPQKLAEKKTVDVANILHQGEKTTIAPKQPILTVTIPEDYSQAPRSPVTVRGKTIPQSLVVLTTVNNDYVAAVDPTGNFATDITVTSGLQEITVTAYTNTNERETIKRMVYLKPEKEQP